jgi:predicted TIM-barrel fold metal-dependent hydrolase
VTIDVHVNLLPPWARGAIDSVDLTGETDSLRRAYSHPHVPRIHARCNADSIIEAMDSAGIDHAICFSYQWQDADRCTRANAYVAAKVRAHSDRLSGLAVVQPRSPAAPFELERMLEQPGILGLKMKPRWGGFSLADVALLGPLMEILASRQALLLTHVAQNFHNSEGDNLSDLLTLLKAFPNVIVVAAHMAAFAGVYACYEAVGQYFKNLYIDISLPANLLWLPSLMRLDDSTRYLYATDFPYMDFNELDASLAALELDPDFLQRLCEDNPRRLLSIIDRRRTWATS